MKISKFVLKDNNVRQSAIEAGLATLLGYSLMYKLLHKQLWEKDKLKQSGSGFTITDNNGNDITDTYSLSNIPTRVNLIDYEFTLNGRQVKPIKYWNIKSPSTQPYNSKDLLALGLNQLFDGQRYNDIYSGDPSDGIYHDDCLMQPNISEELESLDRMGWYIQEHGHWLEYDEFGNPLTLSVTVDETAHTYTVTTVDGSETFSLTQVDLDDGGTEGGTYTGYPPLEYVNFSNGYAGLVYPQYTNFPDFSEHGCVIYETTEIAYVKPVGVFEVAYLISGLPSCVTRVYEDGTCIQLAQQTVWNENRDGVDYTNTIPAGVRYLPLVYLDTGDLVQNRVDFVEQWDEMFELYVHEDDYWYTPLIKIAVIVVSAIISYLATPKGGNAFLSAMFGAISGAGAVSGNNVFKIIGIIGGLYTGITAGGAKAISASELAVSEFGRGTAEVLKDASFQELFSGFISNAGLGNLLQIGSSAYNIYNLTTMPSVEASVETEESGLVGYVESDEEENSPFDINKIITKTIRI